MFLRLVCVCMLSFTSVFASSPSVSLEKPWARPADIGYNSAVYMALENTGNASVVIVGATCETCKKVELHETIEVEGVSKMIPMDAAHPWTVAPGEVLRLAPGGKHVMLIGLTRVLENGEEVLVTLLTKDGEKIEVRAMIQKGPGTCGSCCGS
ncbi:MAG: hypothetical protein C0514_03630 [Candidatus Puniceispirillum sp.]|nr:hypothetical protein [Candidatus Puniceispirillum sp.]